jgi:hypothetical protein
LAPSSPQRRRAFRTAASTHQQLCLRGQRGQHGHFPRHAGACKGLSLQHCACADRGLPPPSFPPPPLSLAHQGTDGWLSLGSITQVMPDDVAREKKEMLAALGAELRAVRPRAIADPAHVSLLFASPSPCPLNSRGRGLMTIWPDFSSSTKRADWHRRLAAPTARCWRGRAHMAIRRRRRRRQRERSPRDKQSLELQW